MTLVSTRSGSARADSSVRWRTLDRARIRLWERSAMRGNQWYSPRIPWYPDVMRPGVRMPRGIEAAEQRPTGALLGCASLGC
jgi:hypothetical protein